MFDLTRKVSVPRYAWHVGHAAIGLALSDILRDWGNFPLLWAMIVGVALGAALIEFFQHLIEGTPDEKRFRDRVADWWDYQLAWVRYIGYVGSLQAVLIAAGVWFAAYLVTLPWRRP